MTEQLNEPSPESIIQGERFQRFSTAIYSLRAISIILIIFIHFGFLFYAFLPDQSNKLMVIAFDFGEIGADLFIFLSAMFLMISLCRKDDAKINWKKWYEGRISRIFPLLWISFLIALPIRALVENTYYDVNTILINMSGLSGINGPQIMGQHWFITFILVCYLAFPLIHLGINENLRNAIIVVLSAFTLYILSYYLFFSESQLMFTIWRLIARGWSFGFGALLGNWIGKNKMENLKHFLDKRLGIISGSGLAVSLSVFVGFEMAKLSTLGYYYIEKFFILPIISLFLIVFLTYVFMHVKKANKPFNFIGKMSYELFLLHMVPAEIILFIMFGIFLASPILITVALVIIFIGDILIAYPLKFMGNLVEGNIRASKKFKKGIQIMAYGLIIYAIAEMVIGNFINLSGNWAMAVIIFSLILVALISIELLISKYKKIN